MKNTLILAFLLLPFIAFSQSYIPIPADSTAEWRVKMTYHYKSNICLQVDDVKYYFMGDTVINNLIYSKLYKSGIKYQVPLGPDANCDTTIYHFTDSYVGAIRNDTGKVFFKSVYKNPETLLYDFTLNIGDTLLRPFFNFGVNTVYAIDTVTISNRQHRRFFIKTTDTLTNSSIIDSMNYITEGIGATTGLVEQPNFESANELLCYAEHHTPIYPIGCSCVLNVGLNEIKAYDQKGKIKLFPNPTMGVITFEFDNMNYNSLELTIYNVLGKQVGSYQIYGSESKYKVNLSRLENGLYYYKIMSKTGLLYAGKIIKE